MKNISKIKIINDLIKLGIKKGDILYISADLLKVGYFDKNIDKFLNDWVEIFLTVVGDKGTLIAPSHTEFFLKYKKNKKIIFKVNSPTKSGSLSRAFLNYKDSVRSKHPTNSYTAIGKYSNEILKDHDEHSLSYTHFKKIIDLNGRGLLLGNVNKNGFFPYHYVQEKFGITKKNFLAGKYQSFYYDKENKLRLFTRNDYGGCDKSNYNFIEDFKNIGALNIGKVGNTTAILYDSKKIYDFFYESFKNQDQKLICNRKSCFSCYQLFRKRKIDIIIFLLKNLRHALTTLKKIF